MSDWTSGYVADIDYTYGYYPQLNPARIKLAFLNAGLVYPKFGHACELGYGQGLSTNIHACASTCSWVGTDFNPAQASFASEMADYLDVGTKMHDDSFEEFVKRADLPNFDFIALHGIWSWISDENRKIITDFIRRKLNVGGVVYMSYNTLPGWSTFTPIRHLMTEHASRMGVGASGIAGRIDGALAFTNQLLALDPLYSRANPGVNERVSKIKEQDRHYLAHEYFNKDWFPMHFADLAKRLESAKVQYACSASFLEQVDALNLTDEQQNFLSLIADPIFKETVRDYLMNQQFRRDFWVKGARKLSELDKYTMFRKLRVLLCNHRDDIKLKIEGVIREVTLDEKIYAPLLDLMSDHKIRSIAELEVQLKDKLNFAKIIQATTILCGTGAFSLVQESEDIEKSRKGAIKLNRYIIEKAKGSSDIGYLASPVTGGGFAVNRIHQLFLGSILQASKTRQSEDSSTWARYAWNTLSLLGERVSKNGNPLISAEENVRELTNQAQVFSNKYLPIIRALQII